MSQPTILEVVAGSPADLAGVAIGDELLSVNGVAPSDVIEYQQLVDEPDVELLLRRGALEFSADITKGQGEPVGLRLNSSIFDRVQTCDNHCEFCFIYQLPAGMRRSLYLKDDDYRLSFLYGNFTTLTRFTELDLARVVEEGLGPLYVSIHATDPEVRSGMLRNPKGGTSLRWLRALLAAGVKVHGQIVLSPDQNNGDILSRTCAEVLFRYPELASVGIVPLGLSKFNSESSLVAHDPATAASDIELVTQWQSEALKRLGKRMFFASDEMYLLAGIDVPPSENYEDFPQHENGIGMARAFYDEIDLMEKGSDPASPERTGEWRTLPSAPAEGYRATPGGAREAQQNQGPVVIVTGHYGHDVLEPVMDRLAALVGREMRLLAVENKFFGGNVGVAGLLVGEDLVAALAVDDAPAGQYLIPDVALSGHQFLDEMDFTSVAAAAKAPLKAVATSASGLVAGAAT